MNVYGIEMSDRKGTNDESRAAWVAQGVGKRATIFPRRKNQDDPRRSCPCFFLSKLGSSGQQGEPAPQTPSRSVVEHLHLAIALRGAVQSGVSHLGTGCRLTGFTVRNTNEERGRYWSTNGEPWEALAKSGSRNETNSDEQTMQRNK